MGDTLKKLWIRLRIKFIIALTAVLVIIGFTNFYYIFEITAQSNDECLWTLEKVKPDSAVIVISEVKQDGVSWSAGIRNGDHLLAIDGVKTPNLVIASHILDRVKKGDYATYTISRNGKVFEAPVLVKKLINFAGLGFALLSFIWIIVAFIVIMPKPGCGVLRPFGNVEFVVPRKPCRKSDL